MRYDYAKLVMGQIADADDESDHEESDGDSGDHCGAADDEKSDHDADDEKSDHGADGDSVDHETGSDDPSAHATPSQLPYSVCQRCGCVVAIQSGPVVACRFCPFYAR